MFAGSSGLILMPLKMDGSEISTIEPLMVAIRMPSVVLLSAIHL